MKLASAAEVRDMVSLPDPIQFGDLTLDPTTGHLSDQNGNQARLSATEATLVMALMLQLPGHLVTRTALFRVMYGNRDPGGNRTMSALGVQMTAVRRKLKPLGYYLENIRGRGWRLAKIT